MSRSPRPSLRLVFLLQEPEHAAPILPPKGDISRSRNRQRKQKTMKEKPASPIAYFRKVTSTDPANKRQKLD